MCLGPETDGPSNVRLPRAERASIPAPGKGSRRTDVTVGGSHGASDTPAVFLDCAASKPCSKVTYIRPSPESDLESPLPQNRLSAHRCMKTFQFVLVFLTLAVSAFAQDIAVTLAWDPVPDADLQGYRLYVGTAHGVYGLPVQVPKGTETKIVNLPKNVMHYAVITSYNTSGLESPYSNELVFQVYAPGEGKFPTAPTGLRKGAAVNASVQGSTDLQVWSSLYSEAYAVHTASMFFRALFKES